MLQSLTRVAMITIVIAITGAEGPPPANGETNPQRLFINRSKDRSTELGTTTAVTSTKAVRSRFTTDITDLAATADPATPTALLWALECKNASPPGTR